MKVLTVFQPWATLISMGLLTYVTRTWGVHYRGELLIHSSKKWGRRQREIHKSYVEHLREKLSYDEDEVIRFSRLPVLGAVMAYTYLDYCVEAEKMAAKVSAIERECGDFEEGYFAWHLTDAERLDEPVQFPGQPGLWDAPPELVEIVCSQLDLMRDPGVPKPGGLSQSENHWSLEQRIAKLENRLELLLDRQNREIESLKRRLESLIG